MCVLVSLTNTHKKHPRNLIFVIRFLNLGEIMKKDLNQKLCTVITLALLSVSTVAAENEVITIKPPRTIEELNAKWEILKPAYTEGSPYNLKPEMSYFNNKLTFGAPKAEVLIDGLNTLNFARYMAGLTGDVSMLMDFIISTQFASALLAFRNQGLSHTPPKPDGVSDDFYKFGFEGTKNSNLSLIATGRDESTGVAQAVKIYLSDLGEHNRYMVGHRYSALDPEMTGTGFGIATSRSGIMYSAMWTGYGVSLNGTGTKTTDYEIITWPAAGYHATDFYSDGMQWSVLLNKKQYDIDKLDNTKVTVTGPNGTSVVPHKIGPYGRMIIFEPTKSIKAGQKYKVEISGLYRNNKPTTLNYSVEFFNLSEQNSSDVDTSR